MLCTQRVQRKCTIVLSCRGGFFDEFLASVFLRVRKSKAQAPMVEQHMLVPTSMPVPSEGVPQWLQPRWHFFAMYVARRER